MSDSELMRHGGAHNMPTVHTGAFALTWQPHVCTSRARANRATGGPRSTSRSQRCTPTRHRQGHRHSHTATLHTYVRELLQQRKQTTPERDGRTARRHHTGILRRRASRLLRHHQSNPARRGEGRRRGEIREPLRDAGNEPEQQIGTMSVGLGQANDPATHHAAQVQCELRE